MNIPIPGRDINPSVSSSPMFCYYPPYTPSPKDLLEEYLKMYRKVLLDELLQNLISSVDEVTFEGSINREMLIDAIEKAVTGSIKYGPFNNEYVHRCEQV